MADADRISGLPAVVTDLILSNLPLREVVRTSNLSKGWRYKWTTIPHLVFDKDCCPNSCNDRELTGRKLVSAINRVLSLHTGPIQVLKVSDIFPERYAAYAIDYSIRRASNSVKELMIGFSCKKDMLPPSLYGCNNLIHLELTFCELPPSAFMGFENLKTLDLKSVAISDAAFEDLISGCPLLEKLSLTLANRLANLIITAPNLQCLHIVCDLESITFGDTHPKLSVVSITGRLIRYNKHPANVESFLTRFFASLPGIERLEMKLNFFKYLGIGPIPERLRTPCFGLHYLSVRIDVCNVKESLTALCILRSSPNLIELEIKATSNDDDSESSGLINWLDEDKCRCSLDKLRIVKVDGLWGYKEELEFIEFILMNSPALEKMYVSGRSAGVAVIIQELPPRFRKASTEAEIVFETLC